MARFKNPLRHVRVASPCKADWDQMIGSERVRFCGQCSLNVYNLSAMTRDEAESLIAANEGRLCVRFYRRNDGSILTQDCPVGLAAVRRRLSHIKKAVVAAALGFLASIGFQKILPELLSPPPKHIVGTMGMIARETYPDQIVRPIPKVEPEVGRAFVRIPQSTKSKPKR